MKAEDVMFGEIYLTVLRNNPSLNGQRFLVTGMTPNKNFFTGDCLDAPNHRDMWLRPEELEPLPQPEITGWTVGDALNDVCRCDMALLARGGNHKDDCPSRGAYARGRVIR